MDLKADFDCQISKLADKGTCRIFFTRETYSRAIDDVKATKSKTKSPADYDLLKWFEIRWLNGLQMDTSCSVDPSEEFISTCILKNCTI